MTRQEFTIAIDKLISVYGERNYPAERVRIIWDIVAPLSREKFHYVVDELIASCRMAPMKTEFMAACGPYLSDIAQAKEDMFRAEMDGLYCAQCGTSGVVYANPEDDKHKVYQTVFRCHCRFGDHYGRAYRKWEHRDNAHYVLQRPFDSNPMTIRKGKAFKGTPAVAAVALAEKWRTTREVDGATYKPSNHPVQ